MQMKRVDRRAFVCVHCFLSFGELARGEKVLTVFEVSVFGLGRAGFLAFATALLIFPL